MTNKIKIKMKERIVIVTAALFLAMGTAVHASSKAECEVMAIHASNSGRGIDTALMRFEDLFKKPPFSAFNTFELTTSQFIEINTETPMVLSLPDGIGGALRLDRQNKGMLTLSLTLNRKGKKPILIKGHASPGVPLFAAGMKSAFGVWVFGIACKSKNSLVQY